MDSITHALLGGAVGFAVAGRAAPRKALLWGSVIALLPDLDLLIPRESDLDTVTFHRGWTHAWLVQGAAALPFAWLLQRLDRAFPFPRWLLLVWLVLATHSGLDALTVYGTQLFWPWPASPVMIGSIFIIDPIFTLPLLTGFLAVLLFARSSPRAGRLNRALLGAGVLYLAWGLIAQRWITHRAEVVLEASGVETERLLATPTPFNSLLWRVLAVAGDHYLEGFASVLDGSRGIEFRRYPRRLELVEKLENNPALERIDWFTRGFWGTIQDSRGVVVRDLRMGSEPYYPFQYLVAVRGPEGIRPLRPDRVRPGPVPGGYFHWLRRRIAGPGAGCCPPPPETAPERDETASG